MLKGTLAAIYNWFNMEAFAQKAAETKPNKINWLRISPFIGVHLACFAVVFVGFSTFSILTALFLYAFRVFSLTGFYHRYFSHRTFSCNRFWQFVFAFCGGLSTQRGALWWASHHRQHHQYSDGINDAHSPKYNGFWWSHIVWFLVNKNCPTRYDLIKDWQKYPELLWLNRFDMVPPVTLAASLFFIGWALEVYCPGLQTTRWQLLVWGFFISTVAVYHVTFCINSLAHLWGKRRYNTADTSRNNWILALLAFGEGWHNNHHHYPVSTRQGFYWYEIDITYYLLVMLSWLGIIKNLNKLPKEVLVRNQT